MTNFLEETQEGEIKQFIIETPAVADWAIEKIKGERSRRDIFVSVAQDKIKHLQEQIQVVTEKCDSETSNLMYALNDYLDIAPAKQTKTLRQLELPSGKIVRTLAKKDYAYDDALLLEYLKENAADYVKTEPKAKWGEFKKDLSIQGDTVIRVSTGEIVDCITIIEKPSSCEVK